jgi:hypothetical protein
MAGGDSNLCGAPCSVRPTFFSLFCARHAVFAEGLFTREIGSFDEIGCSEPQIWMILDDLGSKSLNLSKTGWTQISIRGGRLYLIRVSQQIGLNQHESAQNF